MAEVRLEHLTKTYATGTVAVRELSLKINDGELLVLMGPSGSGKTTTLRLIAGLEQPTQGAIWIGGVLVNPWPAHRRGVAMVFQRPALYPHLNVQQNLAFGARMSGNLDAQRLAEVANILQLGNLLQRKPAQLSGGQQQRVALGRAILRQPTVFLLDEPLNNLDARLRISMRHELHLLQRRLRATMIYVTHDQVEAMTLGERVALLEAGVLQQIDTPTNLYSRPANRLVAACVGVPGMNLLDGEVCGEGAALSFRQGSCALYFGPEFGQYWSAFRGRPLTLGIRPENVRVAEKTARDGPLTMTVALVESLGDRIHATLRREMWTVTANIEPHMLRFLSTREGQLMQVEPDMSQTHLFDGVTGMALRHPESG